MANYKLKSGKSIGEEDYIAARKAMYRMDAKSEIEELSMYPVPNDAYWKDLMDDYIAEVECSRAIQSLKREIASNQMGTAWATRCRKSDGLYQLIDQLPNFDIRFFFNKREIRNFHIEDKTFYVGNGDGLDTNELKRYLEETKGNDIKFIAAGERRTLVQIEISERVIKFRIV